MHHTKSLKYIIPFFAIVISSMNSLQAQKSSVPAVESFEKRCTLKKYEKSKATKLSISKDHYRLGKSSLKWEWNKKNSSFATAHFKLLTKEESPLKYGDHFPSSPTLVMSVYNESPQEGTIKISNTNKDKKEAWFEISLNFKGWRTIWVPYYEMNGDTPKKHKPIDFNYFKISTTASKGKLFFDDIVFSQYQDDRHQYPDEIVPFIKSEQDPGKDHWMPTIRNYQRIKDLKPSAIDSGQKNDLLKIESKLDHEYLSIKESINIEELKYEFAKLKIIDNRKFVLGPPIDFKSSQLYRDEKQQGPDNNNNIHELGNQLKSLAISYHNANKNEQIEIEKMFVLGTKYFLDQGWQAGSNGGTRHHIGYAVTELAESFYVMRSVLEKNSLLEEAGASLHWLFNLGMVLGDESKFHVNLDYLNTQAYYHLMLIFLTNDTSKKVEILNGYSNYLSITLAQQDQEWGYKIDGTSWHHNGHYPAYGMGTFRNVPQIINKLSGTSFRIRTEGHRNFKKAFLTTHLYSHKLDFGFGNAGRHPLEDNNIRTLKTAYLLMAYSGNPEGTDTIDRDVASAYIYLWGKKDPENVAVFNKHGIEKEILPEYTILPYAATAIHRNKDWAAIIKGYSKYVWASEIYVASNRYGRYPANGTIQLLNKKGEAASGIKQKGWDWNRYPGATIIHLPLEELEPNTPLLMFRSNETFAGAIKTNGVGLFSMILNETKGSNADGDEVNVGFPGKLKAKKSVFSFGDKLVCIGTNISSVDDKNTTETVLFQSSLKNEKTSFITEKSGEITEFPFSNNGGNWMIDPYGNGYHILSDNKTNVTKKLQKSYHNKYSIKTGKMNPKGKGAKETEGNFASGWINHGVAPKNASYQYVIYPFLTKEKASSFKEDIKADKSFTIIKADSIAHIVTDKITNTTAYSVLNTTPELNIGLVKSVSKPSLIIVRKQNKNNIVLNVVQPDLNFKQIRANRYINNSREVNLTININGLWKTENNAEIESISYSANTTTITFTCKDGLQKSIELQNK